MKVLELSRLFSFGDAFELGLALVTEAVIH